MNVALTRAKRALFVLCNAETLSQNASWAALMEDARERRCLIHTRDHDFEHVRGMLKDLRSGDRAGSLRLVQHRAPLPSNGPEQASSSNVRRQARPTGGGRPEGGRAVDRDAPGRSSASGSVAPSGPQGGGSIAIERAGWTTGEAVRGRGSRGHRAGSTEAPHCRRPFQWGRGCRCNGWQSQHCLSAGHWWERRWSSHTCPGGSALRVHQCPSASAWGQREGFTVSAPQPSTAHV